MKDFITLFLTTTPPCMDQIRDLQSQQKWTGIADVIHKLKPAAELFGMQDLLAQMKEAEYCCRNDPNTGKIRVLLNKILPMMEQELEELTDKLKHY